MHSYSLRTILALALTLSMPLAACSGAGNGDLFGEVSPSTDADATDTTGGSTGGSAPTGTGTSTPGTTEPDPVDEDATVPPADAGSDAGGDQKCTLPSPNCPSGSYCEVNGCGRDGVCRPVPKTESDVEAPVCGCNGVTYWNANVAARSYMSVRMNGACADGTPYLKTCDKGTPCPQGSKCAVLPSSGATCSITNSGICWRLPSSCPDVTKRYRECGLGNVGCTTKCDGIDGEMKVYESKSCP